jgi:hypothetical protein
MTFHGSLEELAGVVGELGIPCHWVHQGSYELCVFDDGVSNLKLNWWPATGELRLVGDPEQRVELEARLAQLLAH